MQNAIFQVTSRLRDNLFPPEVLNEIRVRNSYGKVSETVPPQVHQPTSSSLDIDQGHNLAERNPPTTGPLPVKMQPQQVKDLLHSLFIFLLKYCFH